MNLNQRRIKATELILAQSSSSFQSEYEPELRLGNFVQLNSGGPTMMIVDHWDQIAVFAWRDRAGTVYERHLPLACVHRVSPATTGSGEL
jgi:hypothetical protein